jgi:hypothetical protein
LLTLAGQLVTKAYSVVVVVLAADTPEVEVGVDREAKWVAAELEWAPADLSPVVAPLITIVEECITGTRTSARCVLRFINHPLLPSRIMA